MKTCYISGPMRSRPGLNFRAFDKAKAMLEGQGWSVISPADLDREAEGRGADYIPNGMVTVSSDPWVLRQYARRDIDVLIRQLRPENGDAVALLNGCRDSVGAQAEIAVARWVGLPFLSALTGDRVHDEDEVDWQWQMMQPAVLRSCDCFGGCSTGACGLPPSSEDEWDRATLETAQRLSDQEVI